MLRIKFGALLIGSMLSLTATAEPSRYADVWDQVKSDPYRSLPQYQTSFSDFFENGVDLLRKRAQDTLEQKSDLLPYFQKLVHPIGICFAGTWTITEDTEYTGYFSKGSEGRIIVRASEAMGNPSVGSWRAFGLAGKIYPTADPDDATAYQTANFFTADDLGGTDAQHFLDLDKTNEPATSIHLSSAFMIPTLTHIAKTFSSVDDNPGFRSVREIAGLGHDWRDGAVKSPRWMLLRALNTTRVHQADFRNELRLGHYNGVLHYAIYVSDAGDQKWQRIGQIDLTEEALSSSCDHRLHFAHPKERK